MANLWEFSMEQKSRKCGTVRSTPKKIVHWPETNLVRNMWSAAIFFPSAFAFFSHIVFGYRINVSGARDWVWEQSSLLPFMSTVKCRRRQWAVVINILGCQLRRLPGGYSINANMWASTMIMYNLEANDIFWLPSLSLVDSLKAHAKC